MKFRYHRAEFDPREEERLVEEIRGLTAGEPAPVPPSAPYWPNMLVRVNQRIDEATSGVALSLSWAARVAIPGVVAVISFLIALQHYVPTQSGDVSIRELLSRGGVDSMLVQLTEEQNTGAQEMLADVYLDLSHEQLSDYFVSNGTPATVMDVMPEADVRAVLVTIGGVPR